MLSLCFFQVLEEYFGEFKRIGKDHLPKSSICTAYAPVSDSLKPSRAGAPATVQVLGMGTETTATLTMRGFISLPKNHPDMLVLTHIANYFSMMEGPLWKQIRGQGFAYRSNLIYHSQQSFLDFTINEATNVIQVYLMLICYGS